MFRSITSTRIRTLAAAVVTVVIAVVSVAQMMTSTSNAAPADLASPGVQSFTATGPASVEASGGQYYPIPDPGTSGCPAGTPREEAFQLAHIKYWIRDPAFSEKLLETARTTQQQPRPGAPFPDCHHPAIVTFLDWAGSYTASKPAPPPYGQG